MNSKKATASYQIIHTLMDDLKHGKLKPGDQLPPERQWSEQLGISRSTLREALFALEIVGLLTSRRGGGSYINENFDLAMLQPMSVSYYLNKGKLTDLHTFRETLEITAAGLAAQNATFEEIVELRRILKKMCSSETMEEGAQLDRHLHEQIAACSRNSLIRAALSSVSALLDIVTRELRVEIYKKEDDATTLHAHHTKIVEAISNHDPMLAKIGMSEHMAFILDFTINLHKDDAVPQ